MNIWKTLGIEKTADEKAVKKAYRQKLKVTRPDDNEKAFIKLRQAYEEALEYVNDNTFYEENYEEDYDFYEEANEEPCEDAELSKESYEGDFESHNIYDGDYEELVSKEALLDQWTKALMTFISDKNKISDGYAMREFLKEGIAYKLKFYEKCRNIVIEILLMGRKVYVSREVWAELDSFFKLSVDDRVIKNAANIEQLRQRNHIIKYNGEVDFKAFGQGNSKDIQGFITAYVEFMDELIEGEREEETEEILGDWEEELDYYEAGYVPYESVKLAIRFCRLSDEEIEVKLSEIEKNYGKSVYTELLNAQYAIYKNNNAKALEILMNIYREMDEKNYYLTYQLAICFRKLKRLYESYLLIKHLTWLKPNNLIVNMAQDLYEEVTKEYDRKIAENESIYDMEHILMARLYIRTYNVHKLAIKLLDNVKKPSENEWEYNVTKAFALLEIYEGANANENLERLESFDISQLSPIDRLELKELKARMLYDAGKYKECIAKCNELLEEYPIAYPIIMLRIYADKNWKSYIKLDFQYYDALWINQIMSNRPEAAIILAYLNGMIGRDHKLAVKYLEKYKDLCEVEYRYHKIYGDELSIGERVEELVNICEYIRDNEVGMPDALPMVFGYGIKNIYTEALDEIEEFSYYQVYKSREYYKIMESLKDTKHNNFSKYQNMMLLYLKSGQADKAKLEDYSIDYDEFYKETKATHNQCVIQSMMLDEAYEELEEVINKIDFDKMPYENKSWLYQDIAYYYSKIYDGENALKWRIKRLELLKKEHRVQLFVYDSLFQVYASYIKDKDKLEDAIRLFEELISAYGKYTKLESASSIYMYVGEIYAKLGDVDKAIEAIDNMKKYSKDKTSKFKYHYGLFRIYDIVEDFEKAYEHIVLYEKENPDAKEGMKRFILLWKMEKFSEASDTILSLDHVIGDGKCSDYMMVNAYCRFFENMCFDVDYLNEIYDKTTMLMDEYEEARDGDNYLVMAEVCMYLGKQEEYEKYYRLFDEFEWSSKFEKAISLYRMKIGERIFKGEYKEAYEYILSMDERYVEGYFAIKTVKYLLGKML